MGWQPPAFWINQSAADRVISAVSDFDTESAVSLQEVSQADFILVVGSDPINEAPMLTLSLRQAQQRGTRVVICDPRPVSLPFEFEHIPLNPEEIDLCLGVLIKKTADERAVEELGPEALAFFDAIQGTPLLNNEQIGTIAEDLKISRRPLIICGTDIVTKDTPVLAADTIVMLQSEGRKPGLFYVLPGANAFGAALIDRNGTSFDEIIAGIEQGGVKALILVECDPMRNYPDRRRLERALAALELLVVLDYLNTGSVPQANIFMPTTTLFETGGLIINQEGRLQAAMSSFCGGQPIRETGGGNHPLRDYEAGMPGADPADAVQLLATIARFEGPNGDKVSRSTLQTWLAETLSIGEEFVLDKTIPDEGIRLHTAGDGDTVRRFSFDWGSALEKSRLGEQFLQLLTVDRTFGTEELSSYSPPLSALESDPTLFIHGEDAERLGIEDGDTVVVTTECGSVKIKASVADNMRAGMLVLPRHRKLDWQQLGTVPVYIALEQIQKI
jgi:NADH-quinone oxidoreductase subunit G